MKAHLIDAWITWVLNYRYPTTKNSNWISLLGHPCDHAPLTLQIGGWEPITINNSVIDNIDNTWAPFHAFLWFLIGSFCYESYSWWSKWQGIWFRVMPVNCGASSLCWPATYTQTHTYDTLHANIYCEIEEFSWRQLTGSEGPTNSLNLTGASGALISMAKHGPQHSSSTILWKETRDQLCSKPRSA